MVLKGPTVTSSSSSSYQFKTIKKHIATRGFPTLYNLETVTQVKKSCESEGESGQKTRRKSSVTNIGKLFSQSIEAKMGSFW